MTGDTIAVGNPVVNRFISYQRKYIEKDKEARFAEISQTFLRLPVTLKSLKRMVNPEPLNNQGQVLCLQVVQMPSHDFVAHHLTALFGGNNVHCVILSSFD